MLSVSKLQSSSLSSLTHDEFPAHRKIVHVEEQIEKKWVISSESGKIEAQVEKNKKSSSKKGTMFTNLQKMSGSMTYGNITKRRKMLTKNTNKNKWTTATSMQW